MQPGTEDGPRPTAQPLVDLVPPLAVLPSGRLARSRSWRRGLAVAVLAVAFLAGAAFFAAVLRGTPLGRRARPRFSASSSAARSRVIASTVSSLRSVALVVPSVT